MKIFIKFPSGKFCVYEVESSDTIEILKKIILNKSGYPISSQRLLYKDKQLEDDRTLADYDIQKESILSLRLRLRGD